MTASSATTLANKISVLLNAMAAGATAGATQERRSFAPTRAGAAFLASWPLALLAGATCVLHTFFQRASPEVAVEGDPAKATPWLAPTSRRVITGVEMNLITVAPSEHDR